MTSTQIVILVLVLLVVAAIAAYAMAQAKKRKHLQSTFGPEYDRAVSETGNRKEAEQHLAAVADKRDSLEIRDLARALQLLPDPQRQVVLLVGLEGMNYKNVAAVLDIPIGTVMSRLHRGREALRRFMAYGPAPSATERDPKMRSMP